MYHSYVLLGPYGQSLVRVLTKAESCPSLRVDHRELSMSVRALPGKPADRGGKQSDHKEADFDVLTCEARLPSGTRDAYLGNTRLPLPKHKPRRIVVIGDTGCRMKASEDAFQACSDPDAWPFPVIARRAAAWHPDLVIHLGDYHYRESPCPTGMTGCSGSPWGYGYDAWQEDLFDPAQPLMQVAPWVVVRGNHESCSRAGQGWQRFLSVFPLNDYQSCDAPENDVQGDYSQPYGVALAGSTQLIVFDSSRAIGNPLTDDDESFQHYAEELRAVDLLMKQASRNIFLSHHPVLGFGSGPNFAVMPGNASLQSVMRALNSKMYYPARTSLAIHGHIHLFEALRFASGQAPVFVAGNSGSALARSLPEKLPDGSQPAPDATVDKFLTHGGFGYLTMEWRNGSWYFIEYNKSGILFARCQLFNKKLRCT